MRGAADEEDDFNELNVDDVRGLHRNNSDEETGEVQKLFRAFNIEHLWKPLVVIMTTSVVKAVCMYLICKGADPKYFRGRWANNKDLLNGEKWNGKLPLSYISIPNLEPILSLWGEPTLWTQLTRLIPQEEYLKNIGFFSLAFLLLLFMGVPGFLYDMIEKLEPSAELKEHLIQREIIKSRQQNSFTNIRTIGAALRQGRGLGKHINKFMLWASPKTIISNYYGRRPIMDEMLKVQKHAWNAFWTAVVLYIFYALSRTFTYGPYEDLFNIKDVPRSGETAKYAGYVLQGSRAVLAIVSLYIWMALMLWVVGSWRLYKYADTQDKLNFDQKDKERLKSYLDANKINYKDFEWEGRKGIEAVQKVLRDSAPNHTNYHDKQENAIRQYHKDLNWAALQSKLGAVIPGQGRECDPENGSPLQCGDFENLKCDPEKRTCQPKDHPDVSVLRMPERSPQAAASATSFTHDPHAAGDHAMNILRGGTSIDEEYNAGEHAMGILLKGLHEEGSADDFDDPGGEP